LFSSLLIAMTEKLRLPPGARYVAGFIDLSMQDALVAAVDAQPWIDDLKRRVQQYGYRYDYRARTVTPDAFLGPLPQWASDLAGRLAGHSWFERAPDQLIVNEYLPGQGISAHVDCVPCFGDVIVSISLLSTCEMVFKERGTDERRAAVLEPRSALLISGPVRFDWTHQIPARKSDPVFGQRLPRSRRLSLTFRTVEVA
jgi:alkylated DNA repair dioxygenase AlkB